MYDIFDHYRLREIQKDLEHLRKASYKPNPFTAKQADIETLQQEVGELRLLVAVLYRLILDKGLAAETDIHALLSALDSSDGNRDGAFHGDAVTGSPRVEPPEPENPFPKIRV
jgi:hypothetical protein